VARRGCGRALARSISAEMHSLPRCAKLVPRPRPATSTSPGRRRWPTWHASTRSGVDAGTRVRRTVRRSLPLIADAMYAGGAAFQHYGALDQRAYVETVAGPHLQEWTAARSTNWPPRGAPWSTRSASALAPAPEPIPSA
jgi:hypothetical protein